MHDLTVTPHHERSEHLNLASRRGSLTGSLQADHQTEHPQRRGVRAVNLAALDRTDRADADPGLVGELLLSESGSLAMGT